MEEEKKLKLPAFFPLKLSKCRIDADEFFACFESNATPGTLDGGQIALHRCSTQMLKYSECMEKHMVFYRQRTYAEYFKSFFFKPTVPSS